MMSPARQRSDNPGEKRQAASAEEEDEPEAATSVERPEQ
jgi:hypothetical protein